MQEVIVYSLFIEGFFSLDYTENVQNTRYSVPYNHFKKESLLLSGELIQYYLAEYGAIAVFTMVFLEYLNLPGFPAGIIMPLAGIWARGGGLSLPFTLLICLLAGLLGSWIMYWISRFAGDWLLPKIYRRWPNQQKLIEEKCQLLREKGAAGVFICKLLPMVRTLICIPAGIIRMNFLRYTIASAAGVFLWNLVLIGAGYFIGDKVFNWLA